MAFDFEVTSVIIFHICVTTPVDLRDDWAARMKQQKKRFFPFVQVVTADCVRSRKEGLLYTILHFSLVLCTWPTFL